MSKTKIDDYMQLSIIIPAYNEEQRLGHTLEQISLSIEENQIAKSEWELIVCDNNSSDNTAKIAQQQGAKVIHEPLNQISRARNTGASIATGDWLLFIDADTYPGHKLIHDVFDVMSRGDFVGCGSTIKIDGGTLFNKLRMERMNPLFVLLNISGGVFLLCEKKAFESIQGFSNDLYAFEEFDFIARLKKYGNRASRKFTVLHKNPVTTSGRKAEYSFRSITILVGSNIAAIFLYFFHRFLPKRLIKKWSKVVLKYWYSDER